MKTLLKLKHLHLFLAWYDCWIGWFYDQDKRKLYICPLPMVCICFIFPEKKKQKKIGGWWKLSHQLPLDGKEIDLSKAIRGRSKFGQCPICGKAKEQSPYLVLGQNFPVIKDEKEINHCGKCDALFWYPQNLENDEGTITL